MNEAAVVVRIMISTAVACFIGFASAPGGDLLSGIVYGLLSAFLCFVPLFVLSRYHFVKSATGSVQTLVCVLVCMLALSAVTVANMSFRIARLNDELDSYRRAPAVESLLDSPDGQSQSPAGQVGETTDQSS